MVVVAVVFLAAVGLVAAQAYEERREVRESTGASAQALAYQASSSFKSRALEAEHVVSTIAALPEVFLDAPRCREHLEEMRAQWTVFADMGVADLDGDITCSAVPLDEPVNIADRDYFRDAVASGTFTSGGLQLGRVTERYTVVFALLVRDAHGEAAGVAFAALDLVEASNSLEIRGLPEGSAVLVLDDAGRVLLRAPDAEAWVGKDVSASPVAKLLQGSDSGAEELNGLDGERRLVGFVRRDGIASDAPIHVAVGVPTSHAYAETADDIRNAAAYLALAGAFSFAAASLLTDRYVLGHLDRLVASARRLGQGDLATRTGMSRAAGELGELGATLDEAAQKLEEVQKALRDESRRFQTAAKLASDLIYEWDVASGRLVWHGDIDDRLGFARGTIPRNLAAWADLIHPEDRARVDAELEAALRQGDLFRSEYRFVHADGTSHHWRDAAVIERDAEGRATRWIGAMSDVTDQRLAEERLVAQEAAEAAARARGEFLANMSHEIRTPLNGVIGMTNVLLDTPLTSEQRALAETARRSGEHLLGILNDVLDISRMDVGQMRLEDHEFDLPRCIEDAMDLVSAQASAKGLALTHVLDASVPWRLSGDASRLRQILAHLLSNAVKFTPAGYVQVRARAEPADDGRILLRVTVEDTGIGMDPEQLGRVFRPFEQGDASTTRTYDGTGLGLAISQRLARLMGGSIEAQSRPGVGSTFEARVLLRPAGPRHAASRALDGRVLILADAAPATRAALASQAQAWGMRCAPVASHPEALAILAGSPPGDAVLVAESASMDAVGLAYRARATHPSLPILALAPPAEVARLEESGVFHAVLAAPARAKPLHDALAAAMPAPARGGGTAEPVFDPTLAARLPLRILLVEDNAVNRRVALLYLERMGYRADVAENGAEAVAATEAERYDLVLMDLHMPVMDGIEATRRIRARGGRVPRIVALTAEVREEELRRCRELGMDAILSKPLRPAALVEAFARHA